MKVRIMRVCIALAAVAAVVFLGAGNHVQGA